MTEYTYKDGYLLDDVNRIIMPYWEAPIMEKAAEVICQNKGRVLNIGFGLGLVDSYIEEYDIDEHWIIECHKDVLAHMKDKGWYDKKNVKVIEGRWEDVIPMIDTTFDGIYHDTWASTNINSTLIPQLDRLLNDNGWFSFWCVADQAMVKHYTNLFDNFGMSTRVDEVIIDEGSIEEHKKVFFKDIKRKYINISAQKNSNKRLKTVI